MNWQSVSGSMPRGNVQIMQFDFLTGVLNNVFSHLDQMSQTCFWILLWIMNDSKRFDKTWPLCSGPSAQHHNLNKAASIINHNQAGNLIFVDQNIRVRRILTLGQAIWDNCDRKVDHYTVTLRSMSLNIWTWLYMPEKWVDFTTHLLIWCLYILFFFFFCTNPFRAEKQ